MNIWRVAGVALMAGLALFLISLLLKLLLIALGVGLLMRVVGGRLASRFFGPAARVGWQQTEIISIDNPIYRSAMNRAGSERIISIN